MPAEALDDDRDDQPKYFGPGRRRPPAKGPVIEAYADARMDIDCPDCAADAYSFCQHPNGALRITPCKGRQINQKPLSANNTRENRTDA